MYGLAAVHPGVKDQRRMQAMIIKHARAMTKSFAHMYHETSQHVLARCGMLTATEQLRKETEALLRRLRAQQATTPFMDLRIQAATLQATTITFGQEGPPNTEYTHAYSCDTCGRNFSSFRLLRAHEAKWHQQKTPAPSSTPFITGLRMVKMAYPLADTVDTGFDSGQTWHNIFNEIAARS